MQTISSMETILANWATAGAKANTNATGTPSDQKMVTQPDGTTMFEVDPHQPYGDGYWYNRLPIAYPSMATALMAAKEFTPGLRILIKKADFPFVRAIEFETQKTKNGQVFNMAWQGRPGYHWKTFDYAAKRWEELPVPLACTITPDVVTHVFCDSKITSSGVLHVSINIDGKSIPVGMPQPVAFKAVRDTVNIGFQLDCQKGTYDSNGIWTPPPPARAFVRGFNLNFA